MVVCTGDKGPVVSMAAIQRPLPLPPVAGLGEAGRTPWGARSTPPRELFHVHTGGPDPESVSWESLVKSGLYEFCASSLKPGQCLALTKPVFSSAEATFKKGKRQRTTEGNVLAS